MWFADHVNSIIASVAAIIGVVLGSVLTYLFQARNARQVQEFTRDPVRPDPAAMALPSSQKAQPPSLTIRPPTFYFLVAGAGFEPATSGL